MKTRILVAIVALVATATAAKAQQTNVYNIDAALVVKPHNRFGGCDEATYQVEGGYVKSMTVTYHSGLEIGLGGTLMSSSWKTDEGAKGTSTQGGGGIALRYAYAHEGWAIAPFVGASYTKLSNVEMESLEAPSMNLGLEAGVRFFPHSRFTVDLGASYAYSRCLSRKEFADGHIDRTAAPTRFIGAFIRPSYVIGYIKTRSLKSGISIVTKRPVRLFAQLGYEFAKINRPDGTYYVDGKTFVEPAGWNKINRVSGSVGLSFGL